MSSLLWVQVWGGEGVSVVCCGYRCGEERGYLWSVVGTGVVRRGGVYGLLWVQVWGGEGVSVVCCGYRCGEERGYLWSVVGTGVGRRGGV